MVKRRALLWLVVSTSSVLAWHSLAPAADVSLARSGTVEFQPSADEARLPAQFQLDRHVFAFDEKPLATSAANMRLSLVTFPSPVATAELNNNTVHCEYFWPLQDGKRPAVVVLHILGGDFDLARLFCRALASQGTAALFLKMPYYGERRQPGSPARMISTDVHQTVRGMTQAVLDIRRARAWLAAQDEIDERQLGVMGISLGGITAALAAGIEPRFGKVCLILAGGDIGRVVSTSPEFTSLRDGWIASAGSQDALAALLATIDPVTYARPRAQRTVLMLAASQDEVVPRACTESLWRAFGAGEIVWWNAGHYSSARYLFEGIAKAAAFFAP